MICPACNAPCQPHRGIIAGCPTCGHRWLIQESAVGRQPVREGVNDPGSVYPPDRRFDEFVTSVTRGVLCVRRPPPARLLDAGCGAGHFLTIAERFGYEAEGVDRSPQAVSICRARGLKARVSDLMVLSPPTHFDVITIWDVVEHLDDPRAVLANLAHLLSPTGILVAKVPIYGALTPSLSNRIPRVAGILLGVPGHVQYFTPSSLARMFADVGLNAERRLIGHVRTAASGGPTRRRLARFGQRLVHRTSGDANMLLIAQRAN